MMLLLIHVKQLGGDSRETQIERRVSLFHVKRRAEFS